MKYLEAKDECNDLKLQNMSQKLVEGSLAVLMLLLVKCGLCVCVCAHEQRERDLCYCVYLLWREWTGTPKFDLYFFVSENTCCPLIQSPLSWFNKLNKPRTEPYCWVPGESWKLEAQDTPHTGRSAHSTSPCPRGWLRGTSCRIITEVPLVAQRRPL